MKIENKFAKIYLDFNATTPLDSGLALKLPEFLQFWGNPSSIHWAGQGPKKVLRESRKAIAEALQVSPLELIFTSGGSEANNTVFQSVFEASRNSQRNEFITTAIEHPSVLKCLSHLQQLGAVVHVISVDRSGQLDWSHFEKVLSPKTALVSMMLANNETGLVLPIREIADRAHSLGAKMHTDAVQALGKIPVNLSDLDVDFASFSAHKFYSLKGCGVLFSKKGNELRPLIFGGGQERHRRGGTENTLGIWAFGYMASKASEIQKQAERISALRDRLETEIQNHIPQVTITHAHAPRLPNTSSLVLAGVDGETLLMSLDVKGFAVSTGAACSSGSPEPSPVLLSLGLSREEAQSSLRVSLGWSTTFEQIENFILTLKSVVERLRALQIQNSTGSRLEASR
ncbi:MAG: cysteine desulfurase family protein [Pseudobdellovibrionaceae bacterium]